ncbi:MAG: DUF3179 domain-containing protein [Alphaproteobacteria bacterium]|nr:DUF3179 domain-containing protein [Alphaproteobacteria bacterium]
MRKRTKISAVTILSAVLGFVTVAVIALQAPAAPRSWVMEWPRTDFTRFSVPLDEVRSGGPPRDGIPAIDQPAFVDVEQVQDLSSRDPVIGLTINGESKAYPLRILTWHEIVNDTLGGVPVAVTYCPLCNAAIVFERRVDGRDLDFGTTGKLRHSDLVMYDRQTESWWQQFSGEAIVGTMTGKRLRMIPSRLESFDRFRARTPKGQVLVPSEPDLRRYGQNPYVGYDASAAPAFFSGPLHDKVPAMAYVVAVGERAWTLELLRREGRIQVGNLELSWQAGNASALDASEIAKGRDIGNVVAQRRNPDGALEDVVYDVTFAFVFYAFRPEGVLFTVNGPMPWKK